MRLFVMVFFLIYGLMHYYLYRKTLSAFNLSPIRRMLFALFFIFTTENAKLRVRRVGNLYF